MKNEQHFIRLLLTFSSFLIFIGCKDLVDQSVDQGSDSDKEVSLVTGEKRVFGAGAISTRYSFSSLLKYIDAISGIYAVPLNADSDTDMVTMADPSGKKTQVPVHIRAFRTKDQYMPLANFYSGGAGIALDSRGNIYVAGSSIEGTSSSWNWYWVVRKSSNGGATWETVDRYQYVPGSGAMGYAVFAAPNGDIFVGGSAQDAASNLYGIIRKSHDQGVSWTTVDSFAFNAGGGGGSIGGCISGFASDPSGRIYAVGTNGNWIVRKSDDGGASWLIVDSYQRAAQQISAATAISVDSRGSIYVAGSGGVGPSNVTTWTVRKSTDHGTTWVLADSYMPSNVLSTRATGIAADALGNVYVTGTNDFNSTDSSQWIVRKFSISSNSWNIVDISPTDSSGQETSANAIAINSSGQIYVAGALSSYGSIKKSTDGGSTWTLIDKIWGKANAIATSGEGVYVTGFYQPPSSQWAWVTRILSQ